MASNQLLSSKVVILEEEPAIRQIAGVTTSVAGFVGVTERGPFGPTMVTASDYKTVFGSYTVNGDVLQALDGFFAAGGSTAYVSRVVHYTDPADPSTKTSAAAAVTVPTNATAPSAGTTITGVAGPWSVQNGQTVVLAADGGSDQPVTVSAVAAYRDSADGGDAWPKTLVDGQTLTISIRGGATQTVTFLTSNFADIAAATAVEVAAVINAGIVGARSYVSGGQVRIIDDVLGSSSSVNVTGGTANTALAFTTGATSGSGNVANSASMTPAELAAMINTGTTGLTATAVGTAVHVASDTTGGSSTIQVKSSSTCVAPAFDFAVHTGLTGAAVNTVDIVGKSDGSYANGIVCVVESASSTEALRFNLRVVRSGVTVGVYPNLTMDPADARYAPTAIAGNTGSPLVAITDLTPAVALQYRRPANGSYTLAGGSDGLVGLVDADFIGASSDLGRTGMRAFDLVTDVSLLSVPGRATAAIHNAMLSYCEITRLGAVFAVLDPPASMTAAEIVDYVVSTAAIQEVSEFGAIYWPRILVSNPSVAVFGTGATITVPPSGDICGVMARNDARRAGGVYDAPAGVELGLINRCLGFESDDVLDEAKRDFVYPHRINPIRSSRGQGRYIDGSLTLKAGGNFPTVSERRGVIFIEQSIKDGIEFARHRNNDESLRATVARTVTAFLLGEMNKKAFRSKDPKTAFFVDFGAGLNPPSVQFAGLLLGRVGLATQKPAQWVVVSFSQDTRSLDT